MVMANPATLASMLDQGEVGYLTMCATWEPIRNVLKEVLVSRKIKEADLDERRSKAIVKSTVGAGDTCALSILVLLSGKRLLTYLDICRRLSMWGRGRC